MGKVMLMSRPLLKRYLQIKQHAAAYVYCGLITGLLVGTMVYLNVHSNYKHDIKALENGYGELIASQAQNINLLEAQLASLTAHLKHLSAANSRLSETGNRLNQQLENGQLNQEDKLAASKKLHTELVDLDASVMLKYQALVTQQRSYEQLRHECKDGKIKSNNCQGFGLATNEILAMEQQIKFLLNRRDVLLSQIERADANLTQALKSFNGAQTRLTKIDK